MKTVIRRQRTEEPWSETLEGLQQLPDQPLVNERSLFLAALAKLSPQSRRIVEMLYIEGLDPKEIQAVLGCKEVTWRVALHRARQAFGEALKELP
jgi:RNA polymerase sigma factor (sigma-70 family)